MFLKRHQGERGEGGAHIALLHSVSNYNPRMGLTASPWDKGSFYSKGYIACRTVACANWLPEIFRHIGATVHIPTDLAIYVALDIEPDTDLLGAFFSIDTIM